MTNKEVTTIFARAALPALTSGFRGSTSPWIGNRCADSFQINRQISHKNILLYAREMALYETASRLEEILVTWALIVDARQAHIYESNKPTQTFRLAENNLYNKEWEYEWEPISDGTINAQSIDDYLDGNIWPCAASFGGKLQQSLFDQHKAIKEELQCRFIRMIANKLEHASKKNSFDRLVLVASPTMIADLRKQLDVRTQSCIIGVLSKYPLDY